MTAAQTARQLLEYAHKHLPEDQYAALVSWIDGASFEDVSHERGLDNEEEARCLVRAAVAALRRRFARTK
jgi:hypothetical protein